VIRGYRAEVVPERVGLPIIAFATVALPYTGRPAGTLERLVQGIDAVVECFRITGEDAYLMKLAVPSMEALGAALAQLGELGRTRSFVVLGTVKPPTPLLPREAETYGRFAPSGAD
jgi:Lrp/AsnC family leucine-responsive transcriptional regulator